MFMNYKDLQVWQKSFELSVLIYQITQKFPKAELFGLVSQMRRCAVSVASNIAEGKGRSSDADFARFLYMAKGSLNELECQVLIAHKVGYLTDDQQSKLLNACKIIVKMLMKFLQKLKAER